MEDGALRDIIMLHKQTVRLSKDSYGKNVIFHLRARIHYII